MWLRRKKKAEPELLSFGPGHVDPDRDAKAHDLYCAGQADIEPVKHSMPFGFGKS